MLISERRKHRRSILNKTMAVNKVILLGNVGKEPEVRTLDNGNKVANLLN